jgi:hypothetical protein
MCVDNKDNKLMANTLDDFLKMFSGGSNVDEQQAAEYHDRFMSTKPEDNQFDNGAYHDAVAEHLQKMPDDQFQEAAKTAIAQAPPQERQNLLSGLLGALGGGSGLGGMISGLGGGSGGDQSGLGGIAKMLGLGSTDPSQMSNDDAAKVVNYARTQNPDLLRQTVAEKPWFVKAMGNPLVMSALTTAAMSLLTRRR